MTSKAMPMSKAARRAITAAALRWGSEGEQAIVDALEQAAVDHAYPAERA